MNNFIHVFVGRSHNTSLHKHTPQCGHVSQEHTHLSLGYILHLPWTLTPNVWRGMCNTWPSMLARTRHSWTQLRAPLTLRHHHDTRSSRSRYIRTRWLIRAHCGSSPGLMSNKTPQVHQTSRKYRHNHSIHFLNKTTTSCCCPSLIGSWLQVGHTCLRETNQRCSSGRILRGNSSSDVSAAFHSSLRPQRGQNSHNPLL